MAKAIAYNTKWTTAFSPPTVDAYSGFALSKYTQLKNAAIAAARRNNAAMWFAGTPSDLAGFVYQDSIGRLPSTGIDPIGIILDRSYGASNLGPELVTNGNFSNGSTGYFLGAGWSISAEQASHTGTASANMGQSSILTLGKYYKLTVDVTTQSSGSFRLYAGSGSVYIWPFGTSPGTRTIILQCSNDTTLYIQSDGICTIDNVSVREVLGFPTLQTTAANKPTLELQANGYYGMRFDGADDWLGFDGTRIVNSEYTVITAGAYQDSALTTKSILGGSNNIANTNLLFGTNGSRPAFSQWGNDLFGPATYVDNTPVVFSGVLSATGKTIFSGGSSIAADAVATKLSSYPGASIGQGAQTVALSMKGCVWLVAVAPVAMLSADRIAIERFAALLSGAIYV